EELLEKLVRFLPGEFEQAGEAGAADPQAGDALPDAELFKSLARLPVGPRAELLAASRQLDRGRIMALADSLDESAPAVASRIRSHAAGYRFDLIEEALLQAASVEGQPG
ncbi:MAG TPA: hypothetical protein VIU29_05890, partial [Candidatus Deferrimicrobiaceae bacterium]